jgi:hypothetical protein
LIAIRHNEGPAAPHQVNVILLDARNRFPLNLPTPSGVRSFGEGQSAVCVSPEGLSCLAVPIVDLHKETSKGAGLSLVIQRA